jgi:hypothetical protein
MNIAIKLRNHRTRLKTVQHNIYNGTSLFGHVRRCLLCRKTRHTSKFMCRKSIHVNVVNRSLPLVLCAFHNTGDLHHYHRQSWNPGLLPGILPCLRWLEPYFEHNIQRNELCSCVLLRVRTGNSGQGTQSTVRILEATTGVLKLLTLELRNTGCWHIPPGRPGPW